MQERLLSARQGSGQPLGQAVLYFGCRRSDQDYLYGSLLEGWAKSGQLTLFTAFSRQQVRDHATLDEGGLQHDVDGQAELYHRVL